jgi:hypothetical protein
MDKKTQEYWRINWGPHACVDVVLMSPIYLDHLTYNHVPNPKTLNLKVHAHSHAPTYNSTPPKNNGLEFQQNNELDCYPTK